MHFKNLIRVQCSIPESAQFRLVHAGRSGGNWKVVDQEALWQQALASKIDSFTIRMIPSSAECTVSDHSSTTSMSSPLGVDQHPQASRAHWEYANKVEANIKLRVTEVLAHLPLGSAHLAISSVELRAFLDSMIRLSELWESLAKQHLARPDGIPTQERLSWFIAAVLTKFHPTLTQIWHTADPALRARRSPDFFACFEDFVFAIYTLVRPGLSGSPDTVLPAMLQDLEHNFGRFPSRAAARTELQHIRAVMVFLQTHWFPEADDVDKSIQRFLERVLTANVQAELKKVLKAACYVQLAPHLQASYEFAPLHAYSLDSVLTHWVQLDSLGLQPFMADLAFKVSSAGAPEFGGRPSRALTSARDPAGSPSAPSAKLFVMDGSTFRTNLASWEHEADRKREEQRFVEAAYHFDGECHVCHRWGHKQRGCPSLFQLDHDGVSRNPACYFYTLKPPPQVFMASRSPPTSVPGGSERAFDRSRRPRGGQSSASGPRGLRGQPTAASVAVVAQPDGENQRILELEATVELLRRECDRAQARVDQLTLPLAEPPGNGRAGAAR